jgi:hypothetical protein
MTASDQKMSPDFFEEHDLDPLAAATGGKGRPTATSVRKKKAGFYLSEQLLERFNRRFHQMKLDGVTIENKSALVEIALRFALDDLDRGAKSRINATLKSP